MQVDQVVILAGGLGTRLGQLTKNTPKSLIKVNNKPFIEWQINYFIDQGIKSFLLCLGHYSDQIIEFVKNKFQNTDIIFSIDGDKMLGTGGALIKAYDNLSDYFFVVYGDSYLQLVLEDIRLSYELEKKMITMAIYHNRGMYDKSNIRLIDNKLLYCEDSNQSCKYIDYGISIISKKILNKYNSSEFINLSTIYQKESANNNIGYYVAKNRFFEIGSEIGILELDRHLKKNNNI